VCPRAGGGCPGLVAKCAPVGLRRWRIGLVGDDGLTGGELAGDGRGTGAGRADRGPGGPGLGAAGGVRAMARVCQREASRAVGCAVSLAAG
jgi:hypothetical protein